MLLSRRIMALQVVTVAAIAREASQPAAIVEAVDMEAVSAAASVADMAAATPLAVPMMMPK